MLSTIALGVLFGANLCTSTHSDAGTIRSSIKFEISGCDRDGAGNLMIRYVLRYQPLKSQSRLPAVLYYHECDWTRDPSDRTVVIRGSDNRRAVVPIEEPITEPMLHGIDLNLKDRYHVLRAGESTAGYVRIRQEHFQKALARLGVSDGSRVECMLSIRVIGETRPPVVPDRTGQGFYILDASGKWTPFRLPNDAGDILLRGIEKLKKQSDGKRHEVTKMDTADKSEFEFELSSSRVKTPWDWSK